MKRLIANNLTPVKLNDQNAIQYITDSMANNLLIQIEYEGSGWRTVQPYSFTTSKDNNLLIMCYKGDGSVRSYRWDRVQQLYVDDALFQHSETTEVKEDNKHNLQDFEIPYLPEYDEILEMSENEEGEPFQDGLDSIEQGQMFIPEPVEDKDGKNSDNENADNNERENSSDSNDTTEENNDIITEDNNDNSESNDEEGNNTDDVDIDLDNDDDVDIDLDEEEKDENNGK